MDNKQDITFADQKIVPVQIEKNVQKSFIEYAMSVIVSRALPDVRDGLKPVHRRILYAMYGDNLTYDKPFRKSATTVGNVLGKYHPHGDSAVYDSMVRLAQDFSMRYPLIEGHGNFGNVDGDSAAAYRYTEARMAKMANEMLADIKKNVVDFTPNFDNKLKEPVVLPSRFPNILVNGSIGIAVGMATNIPPHNLCEVIDGTIFYMEHPDATVADVMQYIKGPDFPTRATIYGTAGIYAAYATGKGHITVRAKAEVQQEHHRIIITEIPYMVNKSQLVKSMADLVKEKRVEGITEIRDESGRAGMRIVVEFRRDANGQVILNQLYKFTQLQDTCAVNMIALVDNQPKLLGLLDILRYYIAHQQDVISRRVRFDLDEALRRAHILEGQKIAIDFIDEVIALIRASQSVVDARDGLMERFGLSEAQAQAIVEMTLGKLAGLERIKIEEELAEKKKLIEELRAILADEGRIHNIIKEEMLEIKRRFGDERRTEICEAENEILLEDLIERHSCVVTLSHAGYIKRQPADTYSAQRRGGKGIIGMGTKDEDYVESVYVVNSHSFLLFFTNFGRVYVKKAYTLPQAGRTAKGTNLVNILEMMQGESVTAVVALDEFSEEEYLMMVTERGVCKRTRIKEFEYQRRGGKIAISLDEGDALTYVRRTVGDDELIIATKQGRCTRFAETEARIMGRTARGVRAMRLAQGDTICGVCVVDDTKTLLTVTESGYGKRTEFSEYSAHSRGGKGFAVANLTEKTGLLAGIAAAGEDDDVMMITNEGMLVRTPAQQIRLCGRVSQGVIVMRLAPGQSIVNIALVPEEEKEEDDMAAPQDDSVLYSPADEGAQAAPEGVLAASEAADRMIAHAKEIEDGANE